MVYYCFKIGKPLASKFMSFEVGFDVKMHGTVKLGFENVAVFKFELY